MVCEKINIKKGEATLFVVIVAIVLITGIFVGCYYFVNYNANISGINMDDKYNTTFNRLQNATTLVDDNIDSIASAAKNVSEASSLYSVALNGFKGLGSLLKLPISFIDAGTETFAAVTIGTSFVPTWALILIRILVIGFILLIVVSIMKGDNNLIR